MKNKLQYLYALQQIDTSLDELEDRYIHEVLTASGNNKTQAAKILGIHPTSLLRRLKKEHLLS